MSRRPLTRSCLVAGLALTSLAQAGPGRAQIPSIGSEGAQIYRKWCVECHDARGFGTVSLERRYRGARPAILLERRDLEPASIAYAVRKGISFMPPFRKTEITDSELAALTAYLARPPARPLPEIEAAHAGR